MKKEINHMWEAIHYFNEEEFYSPDIQEEHMYFRFILMLDSLREMCGFPIVITSGYRTIEYNESIGGVKESSHCKGKAVDISCTDSTKRLALITCALELGVNRIGIGKDFVHFDISDDKPSCIWVY